MKDNIVKDIIVKMEVDTNENTIIMNGHVIEENGESPKCEVCYRDCKTTCAFCRKVYYCSEEHQNSHRGIHKLDCSPCMVKVDDVQGRCLVATRDIQQGELIVREKPLVVGPCGIGYSKAYCTCLGCYKNVRSLYKCSKCGWPVCSAQCEMMPDHALFECKVFAVCPVSPVINPSEYEKIKILRCLLLKEIMPDKWKQLASLESHNGLRKQNFGAVTSAIALYKFIKQECHLEQFDFDTINHAAGVSAINSFGTGFLGTGNTVGFSRNASLLFYQASLMYHDCVPNTRYVILEKGTSFTINIIASRNIREGEPISNVYMDSTKGTLERRSHLMECYYFSCTCRRCSDPSELGTFFSGLTCNFSCRSGILLPINPLDPHSDWKCTNSQCSGTMVAAEVCRLLQEVKNEIQAASSLETLELVLEKYKGKILHPNHYLVLDMHFEIIDMIEKILPKVGDAERISLAKRGVEMCRGCLAVADVIRPGNNRLRGCLLYHLQEVLLTICIAKINQCPDTKSQEIVRKSCKKQFAEILEIMKEAREILCAEPYGSPDWKMVNNLALDTPRIEALMSFFSFKN